jgi:cell shape-determining protein MreC
MTDDLVKRLRQQYEPTLLPVIVTSEEIIARIEALEEENKNLQQLVQEVVDYTGIVVSTSDISFMPRRSNKSAWFLKGEKND